MPDKKAPAAKKVKVLGRTRSVILNRSGKECVCISVVEAQRLAAKLEKLQSKKSAPKKVKSSKSKKSTKSKRGGGPYGGESVRIYSNDEEQLKIVHRVMQQNMHAPDNSFVDTLTTIRKSDDDTYKFVMIVGTDGDIRKIVDAVQKLNLQVVAVPEF